MEPITKTCLFCDKPLRGRIDKKFCDDYCRNNFNNKQNSDQSNHVRNVNRILGKNRRILEKLLPETEETKKITREKLALEGFNFKFHTHQYLTQKGAVYIFNYEYGYLNLENDWILIVKRQEKDLL